MSFQINDKVVCVDDSPGKGNNRYKGKPSGLEKGRVYVVRELGQWKDISLVYITGISFGFTATGFEFGFRSSRFRKLQDIKAENKLKQQKPALV